MSVTIEISELDADLWDAFQRGGPWVAHSEYMQLKDENAKLRELARDALRPKYDDTLRMPPAQWREYDADVLRRARKLGIKVDGRER